MNKSDFIYGIARIRSKELSILKKSDIDSLITANSYSDAERILADKGWRLPSSADTADICEIHLGDVWNFIKEFTPDEKFFYSLVIENDFANLKAAIKAVFSSLNPAEYMTRPYVCDPEIILKAVREHSFDILPEYLSSCAAGAYSAVTELESGQKAEIIIDKSCAQQRAFFAQRSGNDFMIKIAALKSTVENIKVARRCALTGKSRTFALESMILQTGFPAEEIISAVYKGESISGIVSAAGFADLADEADGEFSALDSLCDKLIINSAGEYKHDIDGADAVAAYYILKQAECKTVRMILAAKKAGVPNDIIAERAGDYNV